MSSVRLAFDPQIFMRQTAGGISRVFADLVVEFETNLLPAVNLYLPFRRTNNVHIALTPRAGALKRFPRWVPRKAAYIPTYFRGMPKAGPWNIVHHTYYDRRFLAGSEGKLRVSTIHDMIPELFAGSEWITGSHLSKKLYVESSQLITCVSEATRQDMLEIYGVPEGRVVVIPNSVSDLFCPGLSPLSNLPTDYLLYVGKRGGYKDFKLLPEAIGLLRREAHEICVVVTGPPPTRHEVLQLKREGVNDLFNFYSLDDLELARAYSNATTVIQTSRYEGFGIAPLEGMASGVPVIAARASAMQEVGGDVAQYFTPGDHVSLAEVILRVMSDSRLRSHLAKSGLSRAKHFSRQKTAEKMLEAYRTLLDSA